MKLHILKIIFFLSVLLLLLSSCNSNDVSDVKLNENLQYLGVNDTLRLTTVIKAPEDKDNPVTWTSSNENIAVVSSNGIVKALSEGSVQIVARAGKKSANCEIHISTYKFNNASYRQRDDDNPSKYILSLTRNVATPNSNADVTDNTVEMNMEIFTSPDAPDLLTGSYIVEDELDNNQYTILAGKRLEENFINGSFITDRYVFNSLFLISEGNMTINSLKDQYIVTGNFLINDLSDTGKEISFIYSGSISKNTPKENSKK